MCPSTVPFNRQTEKTIAVFKPTKVDITLDGVPLKNYSQVMFPRHFFDEAYRVLSGSNREVSAEANQILSEAECSLIFTPNDYYAGTRTLLIIDCRIVEDGHIHSGEMELNNSGDRLQISVLRTATSRSINVVLFVVMDDGQLEGV